MDNFMQTMASAPKLSEKEQKSIGQAKAGTMTDEHTAFLARISQLIESGQIDVNRPETFINDQAYATLSDEWKTKIDLATPNLAILLYHIHGFFKSKQTPDSSPQLQQMIDQLWEMKKRMGSHSTVFKF